MVMEVEMELTLVEENEGMMVEMKLVEKEDMVVVRMVLFFLSTQLILVVHSDLFFLFQ